MGRVWMPEMRYSLAPELGTGLGSGGASLTVYDRIEKVAPGHFPGIWDAANVVLVGGKIAQITNQTAGGLHIGTNDPVNQGVAGTPVNGHATLATNGVGGYYSCVTPAGGAANIDLSAASRVTVFLGAVKRVGATSVLVEFSPDFNSANSFVVSSNDPTANARGCIIRDQAAAVYCGGWHALADSTVSCVHSFSMQLGGTGVNDQIFIRRNGVLQSVLPWIGTDPVSTAWDVTPLYLFARNISSFASEIEVGMIVLATDLTPTQEAAVDAVLVAYYGL